MTIGTGIAIAAMWVSVVAMIVLQSLLPGSRQYFTPAGMLLFVVIMSILTWRALR